MVLELLDLEAGYSAPVVGPVSLRVARGEVVGLWGRNGSGKSTLLNALVGLARIFGGSVVKPEGLRIAYQCQHGAPVTGLPVSAQDLLALTGADPAALPAFLSPLLPARLDCLSGGQRQFFQVWACLASPAELVLLDEPTNDLDPQAEEALARALATRRADGAVLVVSHEREFLERACDRILEIG